MIFKENMKVKRDTRDIAGEWWAYRICPVWVCPDSVQRLRKIIKKKLVAGHPDWGSPDKYDSYGFMWIEFVTIDSESSLLTTALEELGLKFPIPAHISMRVNSETIYLQEGEREEMRPRTLFQRRRKNDDEQR